MPQQPGPKRTLSNAVGVGMDLGAKVKNNSKKLPSGDFPGGDDDNSDNKPDIDDVDSWSDAQNNCIQNSYSEILLVVDRTSETSFYKKNIEKAETDETIKRDVNNLMRSLAKGNANPGIGHGQGNYGRGIRSLRSRSGARVYYRRVNNKHEVVAVSSKKNQESVINRLKKDYR